jgi:hypothetical protein
MLGVPAHHSRQVCGSLQVAAPRTSRVPRQGLDLIAAALVGLTIGALTGVTAITVRRQPRRTPIPYGPCLITGAWLGILTGPALVHGYLNLIG